MKNFMVLGEIFQIQAQTINGWPDPGQNFFDPDPSLLEWKTMLIIKLWDRHLSFKYINYIILLTITLRLKSKKRFKHIFSLESISDQEDLHYIKIGNE